MSRSALALMPSVRRIERKQDAYLDLLPLRKLANESGRFWSFHGIPTTVALPGNRYAKSLKGFTAHTEEAELLELIREYESYGVPRPGGYADVFHEKFASPIVNWSTNKQLAPYFAGGWQSALNVGEFKGTYYRYDMRSAYLWSGSLGLPNVASYTRSKRPWKHENGVFLIKLLGAGEDAPYPFRESDECLATIPEIECYGLRIGEVIDGITWDGLDDPSEMIAALMTVSAWKYAGRCYWGRWGQSERITCTANGKTWRLPSLGTNIPWAHEIVSRVKMRLWEVAKDALHVFVDSVITPHQLPTGDKIGDWRLEKTYDNGVYIKGAGQYGDLYGTTLERCAGAPLDSALRLRNVS